MTRRLLVSVGIGLTVTVLAVLLVGLATLGTQTGTRLLWKVVAGRVDGLGAEAIDGRLAGTLSLRGLRLETEALQLRAGAVSLRWSPRHLLGGELVVEALNISDATYTQLASAPAEDDGDPFALPERLSLPLAIDLRDISLRAFEYRAAPEAAPLRIDTASLNGGFRESRLSITELSARGPLFSVEARGQAQTQGAYPLAATIDWQASPRDLAPLDGHLTVEGSLAALRIEQAIAPPYAATLRADIRDLLTDLRIDAQVGLAAAQLRSIGDALPPGTLSAELQVSGGLGDLDYRTSLELTSADHGRFLLNSRGGLREQAFVIEDLRLARPPGATALELSGRADFAAPQPAFYLEGGWQDLAWPLSGEARIASATGDFRVDGHAGNYRTSLSAAVAAPGYTEGKLTFSGRGERGAFELLELELAALEGFLNATGRVRWSPDLQGEIRMDGSGLNPGVVAADFPGDLTLALRASGGVFDGRSAATIDTLALDGSLRDRPVEVWLAGSLQDARFEIEALSARSGRSGLSAGGTIGEALNLEWAIDSPDLDDWIPGATGSLSGSGVTTGPVDLPALSADLEGRSLAYAGYALEGLKLAMDVDPEGPAPSRLTLALEGTALPGGLDVGSIRIEGDGRRDDHQLALSVDGREGVLSLQLAGALQDDRWIGRLTDGHIRYREFAAWDLVDAPSLQLGAAEARLERGCWRSDEARACLRGSRSAGAVDAEVSLDDFGLAYLEPLVPPALALSGAVDARARLQQPAGAAPELSLALDGEGMELRGGPASPQPDQLLLGLLPSRVRAEVDADGLRATVALPFVAGGGINARARVDSGAAPLAERPLSGSVDFELADLGFLATLSPEIDAASGVLRGNLALGGTLGNPIPEGQLRMDTAAVGLVSPGLTIRNMDLRATSDDGRRIVFEGSAQSGGGTLRLGGEAQLDDDGPDVSLDVVGDRFEIANTADAHVYLSPQLRIGVGGNGISIKGEVRVPEASITPQELPRSVVAPSADEIVIRDDSAGDSAAASAAEQAVAATIRVVLGDAVSVDGFGFKGRLKGTITVTQQPGQPALGSGEVNILDGEYRAYGQGLVIDQGKIVFADGPITQPGINVRALRRPAEGIVVGVQVRGPLQTPDFNVFSEPAMTQAEQLSWLVLGRPLEGTSEGEGSMIAQAAIALGLKGGNFVADRLGGSLGVDTIGFETGSGEAGAESNVDEAALVVGKYLSPGLFVSYGIGLFDAISTVRLEYSLDEHWKLSTESSTIGSGGDVTYTIER